MAYEHMKEDLIGTIRKVADFMEIELDDSLLSITEEHASLPGRGQSLPHVDACSACAARLPCA